MSNSENTASATGEPHGASDEQGGSNNPEQTGPTIEELMAKVDELTKHSRKWEERAKDNKAKADRLDELEQASMTEAQKAQKAIEDAQKRAEEAERAATEATATILRRDIALEYGLSKEDAEILDSVSDEDAMRRLAGRFSDKPSGPNPPRPNPAQGNRNSEGPRSTKDSFGDFLDQHL